MEHKLKSHFSSLRLITALLAAFVCASLSLVSSASAARSPEKPPKVDVTIKITKLSESVSPPKLIAKHLAINPTPGKNTYKYTETITTGSDVTVSAEASVTLTSKASAEVNAGLASFGAETSLSGTLKAGGSTTVRKSKTIEKEFTFEIPGCNKQEITIFELKTKAKYRMDITTTTTTYTWIPTPQNCPNGPNGNNIIHICSHGHWKANPPQASSQTLTVDTAIFSNMSVTKDLGKVVNDACGGEDQDDKDETPSDMSGQGSTPGKGGMTLGPASGSGQSVGLSTQDDTTILLLDQCTWCSLFPIVGHTTYIGSTESSKLGSYQLAVTGITAPKAVVAGTFIGTDGGAYMTYDIADEDGVFFMHGAVLTKGHYAVEVQSMSELDEVEVF